MKKLAIALILSMALITASCNDKANVKEETAKIENVVTESALEENATKAGITMDDLYRDSNVLKKYIDSDLDFEKILAQDNGVSIYYVNEAATENQQYKTIQVFPISEDDSTHLYLYFADDILESAKLDEYSGEVDHSWGNADYAIMHYGGNLSKQASQDSFKFNYDDYASIEKELKEKFLNKELSKFNEYLKVYVPATKMKNIKSEKTLEVYVLVSEIGYTASTTINIALEDDKIVDIHVDDIGNRNFDPLTLIK